MERNNIQHKRELKKSQRQKENYTFIKDKTYVKYFRC